MDDIVGPPERSNRSLRAALDSRIETEQPTIEVFKPPEVVAAEQTKYVAETQRLDTMPEPQVSTTDNSKQGGFKLNWPPGKKEWIILGLALLFIVAIAVFFMSSSAAKPVVQKTAVKKVVVPPKPTTVASTLTGLQVDPAINQRTVTGVMIENSLRARPQSALSQAGVVFEAIAEGGITRFLALFQDTAPESVGPIRSARPYFVQWAMGFDAGYAHVGGSPEALANIRAWGTRDLDQFGNGGSYQRIPSRVAPHNVYTSIGALNQLEIAKGYTTSTYAGFVRKKPAAAKVPTAKAIDIKISGPLYNVHYDYNAPTNSYNRSVGGAGHVDANTNASISPNVVIALVTPYSLASDGYHSQYQIIGAGQAYIFQDGSVTIGTWTKPDIKAQISFTDANNKPLGLNPGQTWLTAVSNNGAVTYTP